MKTIRWLDDNFEEALLIALLFFMTLVMGGQVFCRYALKASLTWSEELTRYLFIWSAFLSIGLCVRKKLGLRVDMLISALPKAAARIISVIALLLELALFVYLLPFAWRIMAIAVATGRLAPATQIPMWMMQAAPIVGFVLAVFRIVQRLFMEFRGERVTDKTAEEEMIDHYVQEAEEDLRAGHEDKASWESSFTQRMTKRSWKAKRSAEKGDTK